MGRHLRELRIVISSTGEASSNGVREWIWRRTEEMRSLNPNFPFYIREGLNIEPYMHVSGWGDSILPGVYAALFFLFLILSPFPRIACRWNTTGERLQSTRLLA